MPCREPLPARARCNRRKSSGATQACGRSTTTARPILPRLRATTPCAWTRHRARAPVLSVFGGKITTYRRLAEHAMEKLRPYFPELGGAWTGRTALPGSDFRSREEARREVFSRYRALAGFRGRRRLQAPWRARSRGTGRRHHRRALRRRASPSASCAISSSANGPAARTTCSGEEARPGCTSTRARETALPRRSGDEAARATGREPACASSCSTSTTRSPAPASSPPRPTPRSNRCSAPARRSIPVTGRPAGWCDHIARMWPVDAVVGENGAFYFWFAEGKLGKRFVDDAATRAPTPRAARRASRERILAEVPGSAIASDQPYRETDLAIDYCEDVPPLAARSGGAHRRAHARGRPDREGQLDPRQRLVRRLRQARRRRARSSPSASASICAAREPSGCVRRRFAERRADVRLLRTIRSASRTSALCRALQPKYVTQAEAGAGFAELAAHLLRAGLDAVVARVPRRSAWRSASSPACSASAAAR